MNKSPTLMSYFTSIFTVCANENEYNKFSAHGANYRPPCCNALILYIKV